jgi:hypothetical protein
MRVVGYFFLSLVALTYRSFAQLPTDGHMEKNSYTNTYFHISYSVPKFLHVVDTKSLALSQLPPNRHESLLLAAQQGDAPFGIIVLAEKLHVPTAHTNGIQDGADFLDRAVRSFDPAGHAQIISRKHFTNNDGIFFDQMDYLIFGEQSSGIAARIGDFLIVFKCTAKSASDLAEMTESIAALHRTN